MGDVGVSGTVTAAIPGDVSSNFRTSSSPNPKNYKQKSKRGERVSRHGGKNT